MSDISQTIDPEPSTPHADKLIAPVTYGKGRMGIIAHKGTLSLTQQLLQLTAGDTTIVFSCNPQQISFKSLPPCLALQIPTDEKPLQFSISFESSDDLNGGAIVQRINQTQDVWASALKQRGATEQVFKDPTKAIVIIAAIGVTISVAIAVYALIASTS